MIEQINQWLANPQRNYAEGLALYFKCRTDVKFDSFLQQVTNPAPNSLHMKMLLQKLTNVARIMASQPQKPFTPPVVDIKKAKPITVDPIVIPKKTFPRIDDNPYIRLEKLPAELQTKYEGIIKPLTKEITHYHELAKLATTDDDRKENMGKAASLEDERAKVWAEIDKWFLENETGTQASQKKNSAKEAVELAARIDDLNTNISRARKQLENIKDIPLAGKRQKSIDGWQAELAEKTKRLKELTGNE